MTTPSETVLARILSHKYREVAERAERVPLAQLQARLADAPPVRDFAAALRRDRPALIAEVKKASPSKGVLVENFDPLALASTYAASGAAAISVLTDERFFQGSLDYLTAIRQIPGIPPLLRKDFLVDSYQVVEARAAGADAVLLIVAALEDAKLAELLRMTYSLGMHALVEVHDVAELGRALALGVQVLGVNNRSLHTFQTTLDTTAQVAAALPAKGRPVFVSESGIFTAAHVEQVRALGVDAVLVGEAIVTAPDVAAKARELSGGTER
ncbi:indole-3-glycerol phosphate synthase TrpC [Chloroflexia bacterium SDU3-3]|nr:indole-3-glycerol phosphate synthase TrpC [Chloroflexia bacterium SDU3-3]